MEQDEIGSNRSQRFLFCSDKKEKQSEREEKVLGIMLVCQIAGIHLMTNCMNK